MSDIASLEQMLWPRRTTFRIDPNAAEAWASVARNIYNDPRRRHDRSFDTVLKHVYRGHLVEYALAKSLDIDYKPDPEDIKLNDRTSYAYDAVWKGKRIEVKSTTEAYAKREFFQDTDDRDHGKYKTLVKNIDIIDYLAVGEAKYLGDELFEGRFYWLFDAKFFVKYSHHVSHHGEDFRRYDYQKSPYLRDLNYCRRNPEFDDYKQFSSNSAVLFAET
jgi:hypothetical protein